MPNSNQRGSSYQRRARKAWLLTTFGDGEKAPCWECAALVTAKTIIVDRIVPWHCGGTYRRNNIRVHCRPCSNKQGPAVRDLRKTKGGYVMSSREFIWNHAKDYHWMKTPNLGGDPWMDRFTRGSCAILVRYTTNGRVLRAWTAKVVSRWVVQNETPLTPATRDSVCDELERWAKITNDDDDHT